MICLDRFQLLHLVLEDRFHLGGLFRCQIQPRLDFIQLLESMSGLIMFIHFLCGEEDNAKGKCKQ